MITAKLFDAASVHLALASDLDRAGEHKQALVQLRHARHAINQLLTPPAEPGAEAHQRIVALDTNTAFCTGATDCPADYHTMSCQWRPHEPEPIVITGNSRVGAVRLGTEFAAKLSLVWDLQLASARWHAQSQRQGFADSTAYDTARDALLAYDGEHGDYDDSAQGFPVKDVP